MQWSKKRVLPELNKFETELTKSKWEYIHWSKKTKSDDIQQFYPPINTIYIYHL